MMPRKKRRTILIVTILVIVLAIAGIITYLYLSTDMLKSNKTLFLKYVGKNAENMQLSLSDIGTTELDTLLEQNKYTSNTTIKVNNTENVGTSLESTGNIINQLEIEINGQTDKANQYSYKDIKLKKQDEDLISIGYIENESIQGIRFSDLFRQYLTQGKDSEELTQIFSELSFTEEEKQSMQEKYVKGIIDEIQPEKFSKQSDVTITIDEKSVFANSYTLTLTKEELNSLYLKILENLKQDEIILQKITKMEEKINQYNEQEANMQEQFIMYIDEIIDEINANNIGKDETKIIVYENQKELVRTMIQTPDYEVSFDLLQSSDEKYTQLNAKQGEMEYIIKLRSQAGLLSFEIEEKDGSEVKDISFIRKNKIENSGATRNYTVKYEDSTNRVEASIVQKFEIGTEFEQANINGENSINFDELNEEQTDNVKNQVISALSTKATEISETIKFEELLKVLQNIGILQETEIIESIGITETEKSRFNSQFEMLVGENLDGERILNLIEATKPYINGMEVATNTELKLEIDRNNSDEEVVETLTTFFEKNKNKKYNVDIEYDENGLVEYIIIEIVTE